MARQLKKQDLRHVHIIENGDRQIENTPVIAAEFHSFYSSLYNLDPASVGAMVGGRINGIKEYLEASGLQAIPSVALEEME